MKENKRGKERETERGTVSTNIGGAAAEATEAAAPLFDTRFSGGLRLLLSFV